MNKKATGQDRKRLRVLIADDSAAMRVSLSFLISELAYGEVIGFAWDGLEAVKLIRELKPDLVTLDIRMPGMNGLEVLQSIRKGRKSRPIVIVVSGLAELEYRKRCLELGANHFFCKGDEVEGLVKVLNEYNRRPRRRKLKSAETELSE